MNDAEAFWNSIASEIEEWTTYLAFADNHLRLHESLQTEMASWGVDR
jgi:hypothetical protein